MVTDPLLAQIIANPDDDGPRAVYADRLLAAGDPWGEFIQLQLAIAGRGEEARRRQQPRIHELYFAHAKDREPALPGQWLWRRGFLDHVRITAAEYRMVADQLFERVPTLRTLELEVSATFDAPPSDELERAVIEDLEALLALRATRRFAGLIVHAAVTYFDGENEEIGYWGNVTPGRTTHQLGDLAVAAIVAAKLPRLHMLGTSTLTPSALDGLAGSRLATRLDHLAMPWLDAEQLRRYLDHPNTATLRCLDCRDRIEHPKLAQLRELIVRSEAEPMSALLVDQYAFRSLG